MVGETILEGPKRKALRCQPCDQIEPEQLALVQWHERQLAEYASCLCKCFGGTVQYLALKTLSINLDQKRAMILSVTRGHGVEPADGDFDLIYITRSAGRRHVAVEHWQR